MRTKFWLESLRGKRPLRRSRRRWEDNIKMGLREIGMVWIKFMWLRIGTRLRALVNTAMIHHIS
jgi:hypothetical protein